MDLLHKHSKSTLESQVILKLDKFCGAINEKVIVGQLIQNVFLYKIDAWKQNMIRIAFMISCWACCCRQCLLQFFFQRPVSTLWLLGASFAIQCSWQWCMSSSLSAEKESAAMEMWVVYGNLVQLCMASITTVWLHDLQGRLKKVISYLDFKEFLKSERALNLWLW